jgi:hypothetical protein
MRSGKRRASLGAVLKRLPLAIALAMLVWFVGREAYYPALCWATEKVARVYEWPRAAQIQYEGDNAVLGRIDMRADSARLQVSLTQVAFNVVPFLALVLALPGWWRRGGVKRVLVALAILSGSHLLTLLWHLKTFYAMSLGTWSAAHYSNFARDVYSGLRYFFDIPVTFTMPLVLWVGAFWTEVFDALGLDAQPSVGRAPATGHRR